MINLWHLVVGAVVLGTVLELGSKMEGMLPDQFHSHETVSLLTIKTRDTAAWRLYGYNKSQPKIRLSLQVQRCQLDARCTKVDLSPDLSDEYFGTKDDIEVNSWRSGPEQYNIYSQLVRIDKTVAERYC